MRIPSASLTWLTEVRFLRCIFRKSWYLSAWVLEFISEFIYMLMYDHIY
jgi:hypothetical protein